MSTKYSVLFLLSSTLILSTYGAEPTPHERAFGQERRNPASRLGSEELRGLAPDVAGMIGQYIKRLDFRCPSHPETDTFEHNGLNFELGDYSAHATDPALSRFPPWREFLRGGTHQSPLELGQITFNKSGNNVMLICEYNPTLLDIPYGVEFHAMIPQNIDLSTARITDTGLPPLRRNQMRLAQRLTHGENTVEVHPTTSNTVISFSETPVSAAAPARPAAGASPTGD